MKLCFQIFIWEIKKIFSDKKMLSSIFIMPFLMMGMMSLTSLGTEAAMPTSDSGVIYCLNNNELNDPTGNIEFVPVNYSTMEDLKNNVEITSSDVVLDNLGNFINIYYNEANEISKTLSRMCEEMLKNGILYSMVYSSGKTPIDINVIDTNKNPDFNLMDMVSVAMIPYIVIIMIFQNTSNYAINSIAGEKERGTFDKLLLAPVPPLPIVNGKVLSSTACGILSFCLNIFAMILFGTITETNAFGFDFTTLTLNNGIAMMLLAITVSYFAALLAVFYSLHSKNMKEAQDYSKIAFIIVTAMALLSMFRTGVISTKFYLIPVYNICLTMQDVLSSNVDILNALIATVSIIISCIVVYLLTISATKKQHV